ncbi:MAG TPA: hypothetical protein VIN71_12715 [Pseudomonadales bacterium]
MKKLWVAAAVSMAMAGLTACQQDNNSHAGSQVEQPAQAASMRFAVNFPVNEVSAALINNQAASIDLQVLPVSGLLTALEICLELCDPQALTFGEGGRYYDVYGLYYDMADLQQKYASLVGPQLTEGYLREYARDMTLAVQLLVNSGVWSLLDLQAVTQQRTLTPGNNAVTIDGLYTGAHLILAAQQDSEIQQLSYEVQLAWLGPGSNSLPMNLMSGSWRSVNALNQPAPIQLGLLGSDLAAAWDWDIEAEGQQNVIQAISEGSADKAALSGIHYLNHGRPQVDSNQPLFYQPVNFLFDMLTVNNGSAAPERLRQYNELYDYYGEGPSSGSLVEGMFYQGFDARLGGLSVQGGMFNLELATTDANYQGMEAGAFILDDMMPAVHEVKDGVRRYEPEQQDGWEYQYSELYIDSAGVAQTLYYINQSNSRTVWQGPSDQLDLSTLKPMKVSNGNRIDGVLVEYIARRAGFTVGPAPAEPVPTVEPGLTGEQLQGRAVMALAMDQLAQQQGLTASAASHPLGARCAAIDSIDMYANVTYGWWEGKWQPGLINWSYQATEGVTGSTGCDLNNDGQARFFETGVVENYGTESIYCDNCDGMLLRYRVLERVINDVAQDCESPDKPFYISEGDLNDLLIAGWEPVVEGPVGQYTNVNGDLLTLATAFVWDDALASYVEKPVLYRINDLDADGVVEQYEAVPGFSENDISEMHVCYQPVRLLGNQLVVPADDFLYNMEETINLAGRTATSVISDTACEAVQPGLTASKTYQFTEAGVTVSGTDIDSADCFEATLQTQSYTLPDAGMVLPFNCQDYPVCAFSELNSYNYLLDELLQLWYDESFSFYPDIGQLDYQKVLYDVTTTKYSEVITLQP